MTKYSKKNRITKKFKKKLKANPTTTAHYPATKNGKPLMNSSKCNDSVKTVKSNNLYTKIFDRYLSILRTQMQTITSI